MSRKEKFKHVILETSRELESKCGLQVFLGSLLGTRRSAIGQFFLCPKYQSQKPLQKLTWPQFPSRF